MPLALPIAALPAADRVPALAGAVALLVVLIVVAKKTGWTKSRRPLARTMLYTGVAVLLAAGAWWGTESLEEARQDALLTRIHGAELVRSADPEQALRMLKDDVLDRSPRDDARRRALLAMAATYDALARYADAEATYARIDDEIRAGIPRGPLVLPWAAMRLRAARPAAALELLDSPGASDGFGLPKESLEMHDQLRTLARRAIERESKGNPDAPAPRAPASMPADPPAR